MNKLLGNTESVGMKKNTLNLRNFLVELNRNNLKKNEITVLKNEFVFVLSNLFINLCSYKILCPLHKVLLSIRTYEGTRLYT